MIRSRNSPKRLRCGQEPIAELQAELLVSIGNELIDRPLAHEPDIKVGPFHNIQPYLYWSCAADGNKMTGSGEPAAPGFQWSFSFGNGFQGTDVIGNTLYVMVYAPD